MTYMYNAVGDRYISPKDLGGGLDRNNINSCVVADDLQVLTRAGHEVVSLSQHLRVENGAVDELS
jgi:hypothetical protein